MGADLVILTDIDDLDVYFWEEWKKHKHVMSYNLCFCEVNSTLLFDV